MDALFLFSFYLFALDVELCEEVVKSPSGENRAVCSLWLQLLRVAARGRSEVVSALREERTPQCSVLPAQE